jgi:hypothetical protein
VAQFEPEDQKHIIICLVTQAQEPQGCGQAEVQAKPRVARARYVTHVYHN